MKAMIISTPGPAENFELKEIDKPQLRSRHLLIEVRATSVNPIDTKVRAKQLPFSPVYPAILHVDFAGIVAEVPHDVTGFKVGDFVYGVGGGIKGTIGGALAQFLLVDADLVAPMPANLSFAEAASLPLVSITAWEALLDKLKISSGQTLLIHGGLGGVGHIAAQLGKHFGAIIHTTVSNDSDAELSKKFGADYTINYKSTPLIEYVEAFTSNRGFDFVFDTVGGNNLENSFQATRLNGSVACIATGGNHDLTLMYSKGLSLHSVLMLIPLITGHGRNHYGKILFEIKKLVESGKIKPLIHKEIFNWKEVPLAHKLVESKEQKGKVVLVIE
ncbi:MAG: quinone oxidoreductase [Parachlamydia sp.]|nr:MAG: quinone oxidoreductase [Parachlamydia sp.]